MKEGGSCCCPSLKPSRNSSQFYWLFLLIALYMLVGALVFSFPGGAACPSAVGKEVQGVHSETWNQFLKTWNLCCATMRRPELLGCAQNKPGRCGTSQVLSTLLGRSYPPSASCARVWSDVISSLHHRLSTSTFEFSLSEMSWDKGTIFCCKKLSCHYFNTNIFQSLSFWGLWRKLCPQWRLWTQFPPVFLWDQ